MIHHLNFHLVGPFAIVNESVVAVEFGVDAFVVVDDMGYHQQNHD